MIFYKATFSIDDSFAVQTQTITNENTFHAAAHAAATEKKYDNNGKEQGSSKKDL